MIWQLKWEEQSFAIEAAVERGQALPLWFDDQPQLTEGESFILKAFFDLNSCRQIGMGLGPIPWTAINQYCNFYGLDFESAIILHRGVNVLDHAYLKHVNSGKK